MREISGSASVHFSDADDARRSRLRQWWDSQAPQREHWIRRNRYYYDLLARFFNATIPEGKRILEIGCGTGFLLENIHSQDAFGIDFSRPMIEHAAKLRPALHFNVMDIETEPLEDTFDYIILSDVVNELTDVWRSLRHIRSGCHEGTRLIITHFNANWQLIFQLAGALGLRMRHREQNWFTPADIAGLLKLTGFRVIRQGNRFLLPLRIPWFSDFLNRYVALLPLVRHLCCMQYTVAAPAEHREEPAKMARTCSVVVPALNEKGHMEALIRRMPVMGTWTEIIFIDGHSTDGTYELLEKLTQDGAAAFRFQLHRQAGAKGKGQAVREGFEKATGDVLMILDADLTVQPEDLPKFFAAIEEGHADFVNGARLVYPLEDNSMRFLNNLGNRFFGKALSAIVDVPLMDTLCGTKVLTRDSYCDIRDGRHAFGDFDPFGDFDLLFGAARLNLRMVELPIRYQMRSYGETKIRRFYHGAILARMCLYALRKFR